MMMTIHRQRLAAQGAEGCDGGAGLGTDARESLQPYPDPIDRPVAQEVQGQRAGAAAGQLAQDRLDARRLLFRPGAGGDRVLDFLNRRIAHRLPFGKPGAQRAIGMAGVGIAGAVRQQGRYQFTQRIERREITDRAAVFPAESLVNLARPGRQRADVCIEIEWKFGRVEHADFPAVPFRAAAAVENPASGLVRIKSARQTDDFAFRTK